MTEPTELPKPKSRRAGFRCPSCNGPSRVRAIRRPTATMAIRYLRCLTCKATFKTREHAIAKKRNSESVLPVGQFPIQTPLVS